MLDSRAGRSQGREVEEMGAVCSPVGDTISNTVGIFSGASDKRIRMGHLQSDRKKLYISVYKHTVLQALLPKMLCSDCV